MKKYLEKVIEVRNKKFLFLRKCFREEALRLVDFLLSKGYECKRIYLYGSVIKDKPFTPWSDIDLAIEGLDEEKFLKVYGILLKSSQLPIDLKPFEDLDTPIQEKIKREGEVIYEKR